ncbi:MAG TPA: prepilin-type N-terminal cleavage/methylation domain-containing protein [Gemmatimonadales bacterium]|nr:prepilin-type N-terminal cleavage/methylation domain-containing protein [Gemmatimonadales bacterium]
MRNRHGFTLIELMIVLIIMATVTAGLFKLLTGTQRFSRAQAERVDLQSNVRAATFVLPSELRELNTVVGGNAFQNDVIQALDTSITYRAARGLGFVCTQSTTAPRVRVDLWQGTRAPVAGDSLYVFYKGASVSDDAWTAAGITGVATSTCPNGAGTTPAYTLTLQTALGTLPDMGTPVRTFEKMKLLMYESGGSKWLGAQSLSAGEAGPQPILGPLASTGGLLFQYLDANGAVTATLANIKSIRIKVVGQTTQRITTGGNTTVTNAIVLDSLVTQVSLRNALR